MKQSFTAERSGPKDSTGYPCRRLQSRCGSRPRPDTARRNPPPYCILRKEGWYAWCLTIPSGRSRRASLWWPIWATRWSAAAPSAGPSSGSNRKCPPLYRDEHGCKRSAAAKRRQTVSGCWRSTPPDRSSRLHRRGEILCPWSNLLLVLHLFYAARGAKLRESGPRRRKYFYGKCQEENGQRVKK